MSLKSSGLDQVNLVSSRPEDDAQLLDEAFINAWGIANRPAGFGGHWWVANTDTSRVTLYVGDSETVPFGQDGLSVLGVPGTPGPTIDIPIDPPTENGVPLPAPNPTPATIMPPSNPTGQVYSGSTTDFLVDGTSLTGAALNDAPARFITVSEDGTIAAWGELGSTPAQRMNAFAVMVDNSATGAIYKGVTVSSDTGSGNLLYAANFSQGRIDVFDAQWQPVATTGFVPVAPGGRNAAEFSPFNIERVFDPSRGEDVLIVAYAKIANAAGGEEQSKDGFVAKYTLDGTFIGASDAGGLFNAPWGVAMAADNFGAYSGMLLVGNFGDGRILALDIESLEVEGYLLDDDGVPVEIDGLWDIIFGNGASLGRADSLYFSAGPEEETHGLFGSLSVTDGRDGDGNAHGTAGRDVISGGAGDEFMMGRDGNDTLLGQRGDDLLRAGEGNDKVFGGYGNDDLFGGVGNDQVSGGRGNDIIAGGHGRDTLSGGDGNDTVEGGKGADDLDGGEGQDLLLGGWGNDALAGGEDNDRLRGGEGNDTLDGGAGNDLLEGGGGRDVFVFAADFGKDRVVAFDARPPGGQDRIDLTAFAITMATFDDRVAITDLGRDTRIVVDGSSTIRLVGLGDASLVTAEDFIL